MAKTRWDGSKTMGATTAPCKAADKTATVKQDSRWACQLRTGPQRPVRAGPELRFSHLDARHAETVGSQKFHILIGCGIWKQWEEKNKPKSKHAFYPVVAKQRRLLSCCCHWKYGIYSRPVNMRSVSRELRSRRLSERLQEDWRENHCQSFQMMVLIKALFQFKCEQKCSQTTSVCTKFTWL